MNPELQTLVDRIELLERQSRRLGWLTFLAALCAFGAFLAPMLRGDRPRDDTARFSMIEANRILLRDMNGRVAGGLDVDSHGTARLVLGRAGDGGVALVEAQRNGIAHVTLKGPDGTVLGTLVGSENPRLALGRAGGGTSVALETRADGSGAIAVWDAEGKPRFRAP